MEKTPEATEETPLKRTSILDTLEERTDMTQEKDNLKGTGEAAQATSEEVTQEISEETSKETSGEASKEASEEVS